MAAGLAGWVQYAPFLATKGKSNYVVDMYAPSKDSDASSQEPRKRFQFGLGTLLLVPLFLSPLFLGFLDVSDMIAERPLRLEFSLLLYAPGYVVTFVIVSYRRACRTGTLRQKWLVMRSTLTGGVFGTVFALQLFIPRFVAVPVKIVQQFGNLPILEFWLRLLTSLGTLTMMFAFIGMAVGGCAGLVFSFLKSRR